MKNSIYISGLLSANLMMAAAMFKIFHLPGANELLIAACLLFSFVFLPLALYRSYRESQKYQLLHAITFVTFCLGILSMLFKVMHWQGGDLLLKISLPLPFMLFLPVYLYQTRNEKRTSDTQFLGVLFGLTFIAVFSVMLTL